MTGNKRKDSFALAIIAVAIMLTGALIPLTSSNINGVPPSPAIEVWDADDLARVGSGVIYKDEMWTLDANYIQMDDITLPETSSDITITFSTDENWGVVDDYLDVAEQGNNLNLYIDIDSDIPGLCYDLLYYYDNDSVSLSGIPVDGNTPIMVDSGSILYYYDHFIRIYKEGVADVTINIPFITEYDGYEYDYYEDVSTNVFKNFQMFVTYSCNQYPIGGQGRQFTGTYDGGGHVISGLNQNITFGSSLTDLPNYLSSDGGDLIGQYVYAGLFAYLAGEVRNLGMIDGEINLKNDDSGDGSDDGTAFYSSLAVGGIVGEALNDAKIEGCYNSNSISASSTRELRGSVYMGGIVGCATDYDTDGFQIQSCFNTGNLTSPIGMSYVGGIIGYAFFISISECYNTGEIVSTPAFTHKTSALGGIAGYMSLSTVTDCYNTADITGYVYGYADIWPCNSYIGGIVGWSELGYNFISNCYSIGQIALEEHPMPDGVGIDSRPLLAGGIVGHEYEGSTMITNCYYSDLDEILFICGIKEDYWGGYSYGIIDLGESRPPQFESGNKEQSALKSTDPGSSEFPYYSADLVFSDQYETYPISGWNFGIDQNRPPAIWSFDTARYNNGYPILTTFLREVEIEASPGGHVESITFYSVLPRGIITAEPSEGYIFDYWETEETDAERIISILHWKQDAEYSAYFAPYHMITASSDEGSVISPVGDTKVKEGDDLVLEFNAKTGYRLTGVFIDEEPLENISSGEYTFYWVEGSHTIHVTSESVAVPKYSITATSDLGSTISPSGAVSVEQGDNAVFSFVAKDGYALTSVSINGTIHDDLIDAGSYTFTNVQRNHAIAVTSEEITTIILTVNTSGGSGSISFSIDGGDILPYTSPLEVVIGSTVTLYASGTEDSGFNNWVVAGEEIDSSTMVLVIEGSITITAVFGAPAIGSKLSPEVETVALVAVTAANVVIIIALLISALENLGFISADEGWNRFISIKKTFKIIAMIIGIGAAVGAVTLVGSRRVKKGGDYVFELKVNNQVLDDIAADAYHVEYRAEGSEEWIQLNDELGKFTIPNVEHPLEIKVIYNGE